MTPIQLLSKLVQKPSNTYTLPLINIIDMHMLIKGIDNSNFHSHDEIPNLENKVLYIEISPDIVHFFNSIITTGIFPSVFKLSRILPAS